MKIKRLFPYVILLQLLVTIAIIIPQSYAETTPMLKINPTKIVDTTITPGKSFNITIEILNVSDMYAYEFKIFYKNSVLNATKAVRPPGHFMEPSDPTKQFIAKWEIKNDFNATHGRIFLGFTLLSPEEPKSGSGVLAQITFKAVGVGSTPITFKDTKLADSAGNSITHTSQDGYFSNKPPPPPALVYVEPEKLIDVELTPCQNFTVNVNIQNAAELNFFNFTLTYKPEILEALNITEGTFLKSLGPTSTLTYEINNTGGYLKFAVKLQIQQGASGNGTLATIEFHVKEFGASKLILQEITLKDPEGETLPYNKKDGYFSNVIFAKLAVDPPEIINPTLVPGKTFTINITIENVEDLYSYAFQLKYEPPVLTCIGVYVNPVLNETNFTSNFSVNDGEGKIKVEVAYYPPANPISTTAKLALVTLTFKIDTWGISNLTLQETSLTDPQGKPIPHETESGYFQSVIRNIAIINVEANPITIYENYKVNITVTVLNKGDLTETFNVTIYYDNTIIQKVKIENLPSKENRTFIIQWNTMGLSPGKYTIKAEAQPVPYESDLTDNTYIDGTVTINITGDINGDGIVDIYDIVIVGLAFSSKPGDPNWDPRADLNQDGQIDIFDLVLVAINFGRKL
ncbi:MAG: cohesin domain-containing protein [Candidatus Bathyarchaeia archaeon]